MGKNEQKQPLLNSRVSSQSVDCSYFFLLLFSPPQFSLLFSKFLFFFHLSAWSRTWTAPGFTFPSFLLLAFTSNQSETNSFVGSMHVIVSMLLKSRIFAECTNRTYKQPPQGPCGGFKQCIQWFHCAYKEGHWFFTRKNHSTHVLWYFTCSYFSCVSTFLVYFRMRVSVCVPSTDRWFVEFSVC